jgi:hypothetical protein
MALRLTLTLVKGPSLYAGTGLPFPQNVPLWLRPQTAYDGFKLEENFMANI